MLHYVIFNLHFRFVSGLSRGLSLWFCKINSIQGLRSPFSAISKAIFYLVFVVVVVVVLLAFTLFVCCLSLGKFV